MDSEKPDCSLPFDANATCTSCGQFGAYLLEGESLCAECYEKRGSCCAEFGGDDLWRARQEKQE
jgi:hypothetical protein